MKFNDNLLLRYMSLTPLALAFERFLECQLYRELPFERPILDLGCGEGIFAKVLFAEQVDTGIDPNPKELVRARQLNAYQELIQCYGDNIPKQDNYFKTIFSNSVLEHIPDLTPVLNEIIRILSPGGVFIFTVPSDKFDQYSICSSLLSFFGLNGLALEYRNFYNRFWKHYHYYTPDKWAAIISEHGFEIIQVREYDPEPICMLNDFLAPFGIFHFINKKLFNRWVLFPKLRRILYSPFSRVFCKLLGNDSEIRRGGLVFIMAKKRTT